MYMINVNDCLVAESKDVFRSKQEFVLLNNTRLKRRKVIKC